MPHVTIKGVSKVQAKTMCDDLIKIIISEAKVERNDVKVFHSPIERIDGEEEIAVDVYWMPRAQEICDRVVDEITHYVKNRGHAFVQVTFTNFKGCMFYENGRHY